MPREAMYYSVIRVVPHPVRDEAVNLGVVIVNEAGDYADYRLTGAYKVKLRSIAPDYDTSLVSVFLKDFTSRFAKTATTQPLDQVGAYAPTKETLDELANQFAYQVRFTTPRAYVTDNPKTALDDLFREFVAPLRHAAKQVVDRLKIRLGVKRTLTGLGVPKDLVVQNPELQGRHGKNTLDLGVRAGENAHLTLALEPISFSIPSQDDVIRERDHLTWVAYDVGAGQNGVTIGAVVSEPLRSNQDIYDQALATFRDLGISTVQFDRLDDLRNLLQTT